MRLIDADELMNALQNFFDKREKDQIFSGSRGVNVSWNDAICFIKAAPTIDAVPVVRCEECIFRNDHWCMRHRIDILNLDFFCSDGQKWSEDIEK